MTLTTPAVYENGVLRPPAGLPLAEGTRVQLVVSRPLQVGPDSPDEAERRKNLLDRLHRLDEEADAEPDDGYDIAQSLNDQRRRVGARAISNS